MVVELNYVTTDSRLTEIRMIGFLTSAQGMSPEIVRVDMTEFLTNEEKAEIANEIYKVMGRET